MLRKGDNNEIIAMITIVISGGLVSATSNHSFSYNSGTVIFEKFVNVIWWIKFVDESLIGKCIIWWALVLSVPSCWEFIRNENGFIKIRMVNTHQILLMFIARFIISTKFWFQYYFLSRFNLGMNIRLYSMPLLQEHHMPWALLQLFLLKRNFRYL